MITIAKFQNGKSVINSEINPAQMFVEVFQTGATKFEIVARDMINIFTDDGQITRTSADEAKIDARDFSMWEPEDF